jgi:hypothetical protein
VVSHVAALTTMTSPFDGVKDGVAKAPVFAVPDATK